MPGSHQFEHARYRVTCGKPLQLKSCSTTAPSNMKLSKSDARKALSENVKSLAAMQRVLWASRSHSLLIILQAMDAAGKDGTIRHVMSGVNPQGCSVHSFGAPSSEELEHHFLWRAARYLPERGRITLFNRSYYEEVLIVRVHTELLEPQRLPHVDSTEELWGIRYDEINSFERSLVRHGTPVLKFFLHLSRDEQRKRILERLDNPAKNWKFCRSDIEEREHWSAYQHAYETMLNETSTDCAPWYVIPADDKWFTRALVADIVRSTLADLGLQYPNSSLDEESLRKARQQLIEEHEN